MVGEAEQLRHDQGAAAENEHDEHDEQERMLHGLNQIESRRLDIEEELEARPRRGSRAQE